MILKGFLLWTTCLLCAIFIAGFDGILQSGYLGEALLICVIACLLSAKYITFNDFIKLTFYKKFYK